MIDPIALAKGFAGGASGAGAIAIPFVMLWATPIDTYNRHVAENERTYILDVVEKARNEPEGNFKLSLCRSLTEAMGRLCASAPDDSLCQDRRDYFERAGCE